MSMLRFTADMALATVVGIASFHAQQTSLTSGLPQPTVQPEATPGCPVECDEAQRAATGSQSSFTLEQALVTKLKKVNQAEIELAQLAKQTTDSQEMRQLAQTLIDDLLAFNQDLKKLGMKSDKSNVNHSVISDGDGPLQAMSDR